MKKFGTMLAVFILAGVIAVPVFAGWGTSRGWIGGGRSYGNCGYFDSGYDNLSNEQRYELERRQRSFNNDNRVYGPGFGGRGYMRGWNSGPGYRGDYSMDQDPNYGPNRN